MRQQDGLFYSRKNVPFVLSWDKASYRLEPVTELPGVFVVPAPRDRIFKKVDFPSALLVVAERGGGLTHFVNWLCSRSRSTGKSKGSGWESMDLEAAHRALCVDMNHLGNSLKIILDRTSAIGGASEEDNARLAEIAAILESPGWRELNNQIVCATREVHKLKQDLVYSSILRRGVTCRLPHFSSDELIKWIAELGLKYGLKNDGRSLSNEIKRWIGGQPTLTHNFFRLVDDRLQKKSVRHLNGLVSEVGEFLQNHRPHIVDHWARDLHGLLKIPHLRRCLATYTSGAKKVRGRDVFDEDDARLFLAGWVGLDPDGYWGIRSRCHEQWAREILRGEL